MNVAKKILGFFASLKLTVLLLASAMLVVYAGTLAQRTEGIWYVIDQYFRVWFAYIPFQNLIPFVDRKIPGGFMFLGGQSIVVLILVNLLAAHAMRFKFVKGDLVLLPLLALSIWLVHWAQATPTVGPILLVSLAGVAAAGLTVWLHKKRAGVIIVHFGLILLLVAELVTTYYHQEAQMVIGEGESSNYVQDIRTVELAVTDPSSPEHDHQVVIPAKLLEKGGVISHPDLPFDVKVDAFYWNSEFFGPNQGESKSAMKATAGKGLGVAVAVNKPRLPGTTMDESDLSSIYATPIIKGKEAGRYLMTLPIWMPSSMLAPLGDPQSVAVAGADGKEHSYLMQLRYKRSYRPYSVHLKDVQHLKHIGTEMAAAYSSRVRLVDAAHGVDREITIQMNEPLRYRGETFFQSGVPNPTTTVLQVVSNPGWLMPYVACGVGAVGLLLHFLTKLVAFLSKRLSPSVTPGIVLPPVLPPGARAPKSVKGGDKSPRPGVQPMPGYVLNPVPATTRLRPWLVPVGALLLALFYTGKHAFQGSYKQEMNPAPLGVKLDLESFSKLPVNYDGRTMPLDSVARGSAKIIGGRETVQIADPNDPDDTVKVQAIEWFADVLANNKRAGEYKVFRIDHPQLKTLLGLKTEEKLFTWDEVSGAGGNMSKLQAQVEQAQKVEEKLRDPYQKGVLELYQHITRFIRLLNASEQAMLDSLLDDRIKGAELVLKGMNAGVFVAASRRTDEQNKMVFTDPALRQIHNCLHWLPIVDTPQKINGRKDNLVFIAPMSPDDLHWYPLARRVLVRLKATAEEIRQTLSADGTTDRHQEWAEQLKAVTQIIALKEADLEGVEKGQPAPELPRESADAWFTMLRQLRENDVAGFNSTMRSYREKVAESGPVDAKKAGNGFEKFFNRFDPFVTSFGLYVGVLIFTLLAMIGYTRPLLRAAVAILIVTVIVHSFGLIARIYITGHAPVTNLYSTAPFIGWAAAFVCLLLEFVFKNGLASLTAAVMGMSTALLGYVLDLRDADTMHQLVAVLDTNIWLATHVVIVTLGYAAMLIAGVMAAIYVLRGVLSTQFHPAERKDLSRMTYGIMCFALFASFVGTVLGGIWADQSWGRFWGWDPKENGAILVVLWAAVVLHARWGGIAKERGVAVLSILGMAVTAWSWFGTNLMGVGLHAYGFMDGGVFWLLLFWGLCGALVVVGMLPKSIWRSLQNEVSVATVPSGSRPERAIPIGPAAINA